MAEGDTILRTARRLEAALAGRRVAVAAPNPRGRAAGVDALDGAMLRGARALGKHLLLDFGELTLHSHLGMSGSWHLYRRGAGWRRPRSSAWVVLDGGEHTAAQWGGPTLRVLRTAQLRRDPTLARLGPDVLAPAADPDALSASLRVAGPERELGEALLDQTLIAGVGNVFKSEGCFAARLSPWRRLGELDDGELRGAIVATRELMQRAVADGRQPRAVYRRRGRPCPTCGRPIRSRGQGDANRTTYWCPTCQP